MDHRGAFHKAPGDDGKDLRVQDCFVIARFLISSKTDGYPRLKQKN